MALLNIKEYPAYVNRLLSGQMKLVAFGVNPMINLAYPLRPHYFVYDEAIEELPEHAKSFWQQAPLERLAEENPEQTMIMVCGGHEDRALKAVSQFGNFPIVRFFTYEFLLPYLLAMVTLPTAYKRKHKAKSAERAIVVRGALSSENHFLVLQKLANDHPNDFIVLSTWADVPAQDLERAASLCDEMITSEKPPYAGSQNRNMQVLLAQKGLALACAQEKIKKILICRTDTLFTRAATLDGFDLLMDKFPIDESVKPSQKGRMIIPNIYTRRYIPYHCSDLFTYGWKEDVAAFWDASFYDDRLSTSTDFLDKDMETTMETCLRNKAIVETFFWQNYMEKIGRKQKNTIRDWMEFLRDYVVVVDMHAQRILWTSKEFRDHAVLAGRFKTCFNQADWMELQTSPIPDYGHIDMKKVIWSDFVDSLY